MNIKKYASCIHLFKGETGEHIYLAAQKEVHTCVYVYIYYMQAVPIRKQVTKNLNKKLQKKGDTH